MASRVALLVLTAWVWPPVEAFPQASQVRDSPAISFNGDIAKPVFELRNWRGLAAGSADMEWRNVFAVFVDQAGVAGEIPPLSGSYEARDSVLVFTPRYPLQPGLTYRAVFRPDGEGGSGGDSAAFAIPKAATGPPTAVEQVYPTADTLPENLLKFYVHFSAAMSRGEAYRRVALLDEAGTRIEFPFLELDQELWDPEGKRLTLLFDPGRVKRDLLPNIEVGSPLREGGSYTLVIDRDWPDAKGRPLKEGFRKSFAASAPDHETPSETTWRLVAPKAGTADPLTVRFPEPMDQALLVRVMDVTTPEGKKIRGSILVDEQETRWRFRPDAPWQAGDYLIDAATVLEDLAGNTLVRPFEVDVFEKVQERVERVSRTVRFRVAR
jgi:hypothetical protein